MILDKTDFVNATVIVIVYETPQQRIVTSLIFKILLTDIIECVHKVTLPTHLFGSVLFLRHWAHLRFDGLFRNCHFTLFLIKRTKHPYFIEFRMNCQWTPAVYCSYVFPSSNTTNEIPRGVKIVLGIR